MLPPEYNENASDMEQLLKTDILDHEDTKSSVASPPHHKPKINFKEIECDVSVEGARIGNDKERREFSFTLYDFEGHGKITKDDIAGLVTTIYETLGSSIRVPHNGSKTIKVKLTVSPTPVKDEKTPPQTPPPPAASPGNNKNKREPCAPTRRERKSFTRKNRHRRCSLSSSTPSEDREADVSDVDEDAHPRLSAPLPTYQSRVKKRTSSSLQRQELLQIIQANMEKNNLSFNSNRKNAVWEKDKAKPTGLPKLDKQRKPSPSSQPFITRTPSHHYKHRHREVEQARAMAQVVRWLEQEFSDTKSPNDSYSKHSPPNSNYRLPSECYEHHHIHEHVHHHYHHYHDSPVLVQS